MLLLTVLTLAFVACFSESTGSNTHTHSRRHSWNKRPHDQISGWLGDTVIPSSFIASVNKIQEENKKIFYCFSECWCVTFKKVSIRLHLFFFCSADQKQMIKFQILEILMLIFGKNKKECCVFVIVLKSTHQGCGRSVLTGLMLRSLDPGLQVSGGMEVLALISAAAALDVVHADNHWVLTAVHHASLHRVSVAAVALTSRAITTLEFSTNLVGPARPLINIYRSSYLSQT